MAKARKVFVCESCGFRSLRWFGCCPECGEWNTLVERIEREEEAKARPSAETGIKLERLSKISAAEAPRIILPFSEVNRVLGGGIVPGSLVLIGGEPGVGKSTLLLMIAGAVSEERGEVLYISGEESPQQIKMRAERLGISGERILLLSETELESLLSCADEVKPKLLIVDSIQTVYLEKLGGVPGTIAQVREATLRLMRWAKSTKIPVFIAGHVTKEGVIAGPSVLEHMVDCVLYLEGERFSSFRILRTTKNRFGSTNEVGVFEMTDRGLLEVKDPSGLFLTRRKEGVVGSIAVPVLEGTRVLVVEIQALTNPTPYPQPRRTVTGLDLGRLLMIAAVLSRRAKIPLADQDIIANVVGGIRVDEPAADLGLAIAIASSRRNIRISPTVAAIGEVGLDAEIRPISQIERRIAEAAKLGFESCLVPKLSAEGLSNPPLKIIPVGTLIEALDAAFSAP